MDLFGYERDAPSSAASDDLGARLSWLLRLRWLVVPPFLALVLITDILRHGSARHWGTLVVVGALFALNGTYSHLLARRLSHPLLLAWTRFEAALIVSVPAVLMVVEKDLGSPLRYGVTIGVVGAALVLSRPVEVVAITTYAIALLVATDSVLLLGRDGGPDLPSHAARWAFEAGVLATVAAVAIRLQHERHRAALRLGEIQAGAEKARAEWDATFESLAEMVVITNPAGLVVRTNRAFANAAAARPHELAGRPLDAVLAGHPDRWWKATDNGIVEIEDPVFDSLFEVTITRAGDRIIRVARDVGEQRRLYGRLVQADKLAAVGVLATGVAHEINNPTAFITSNLTELRRYLQSYESAFSELAAIGLEAGSADRVSALLQRPEVSFARREALAAISESLQGMERIRQIVASLRSVARRDQPGEPMQPVPLAELIESVVRTAAHELKSASARVDTRQACHVLGHHGELVDVVLNLLVNAIQARDPDRPNHVSVELDREGAMAVIRVSDTGRGISTLHMKRLFEPFFTTKAPGEGTGLALSLARHIVFAHGGSIDVQTEVGRGTVFTVRLPICEVETAAAAGLSARSTSRSGAAG